MSIVAEKVRIAFLGKVIPMELRESYHSAMVSKGCFFIPYSCVKFWKTGSGTKLLEDQEIDWWDGSQGVSIQF